MATSTQLIALALVTVFHTFLFTASAAGYPPPGCVKWRYDSGHSQWKYKCDGGRLILHENDLSYVDERTREYKKPSIPLGPELECTCDKEGTTYGYTCPGASDCPYNYPSQEFRHLQAVVKSKTYGHKYKVTGFGYLKHRIYPDGTQVLDVIAQQIEKGLCTLQCGYTHSACEKRCPSGQIPSAWVCTAKHGYNNQIFSAHKYQSLKYSLSLGNILRSYGDNEITVEYGGITSQLDIKIAIAITEGTCKPVCESNLTGQCSRPCEKEGVSHFSCGKDKISKPYFTRLATMFDYLKNIKLIKAGASPIYELSGPDKKTAILVDGKLLKHISHGECQPICNEPAVKECYNSCGKHGPSEYVCEVDSHYNPWLLPEDCDKGDLSSKHAANDKGRAVSFHHLSSTAFSKISAAVASGTCRFIHRPESYKGSYYSCLGGKQKVPSNLYSAIYKNKCSPGCNKEIECGHKKTCNKVGPTVCKSKECDIQIREGLSGAIANFVLQGRCLVIGGKKYLKQEDQIWTCPDLYDYFDVYAGGIYIDQETYSAVYYSDCEATCLNNVHCKCGDARPAVSIYSGNLPVKHNKPLAGPSAEFVVTSTHPLLPLTSAFFDVRGPRYYHISATPGLDPTIQYLNIKLTEPYTGPVSFSLNRYTQSLGGDSICNLDYAHMDYYASTKHLPIVYEGTCVNKEWKRQEGPSISFKYTPVHKENIHYQFPSHHGLVPSYRGEGHLDSFSLPFLS